MMYSAYKLNKQGDKIQPWCIPSPVWNQSCSMSSSNCCFLTYTQIFQEADQVVGYSHLFKNFPQFIVIHTVKGFGIVNKTEIDVFLELSCFFDDPADVGNLISGSSAFSKTSLNIWKFMVHVLLKPLTVWITINCGKFWKRWEYQTTWPASWETYMQVRKQQLELDMEQQTVSK